MTVNFNNLKKVYVKNVKLVAKDEVFYSVPNADSYAFSNYGRLYKVISKDESPANRWKFVKPIYSMEYHDYGYDIVFNDNEPKVVDVKRLIKDVFHLPRNTYIAVKNKDKKRNYYALDNLYIFNRDELIEYIGAKCEKRLSDLDLSDNEINLDAYICNINEFLYNAYEGMMRRGSNKSYKKHNPQYKDTTICVEWYKNPDAVKAYILDHLYIYPNCKFVMDKDLMTLGEGKEYAPEKAIPLPTHINSIFRRCNKYRITKKSNGLYSVHGYGDYRSDIEALQAARDIKSRYLLSIAEDEERKGYLPDYIIAKIREWAYKCKRGEINIWEPSKKHLSD